MINFGDFKGVLKKSYNPRLTLKILDSKVFLCSRAIRLKDSTAERIIKSPKVLVKTLITENDVIKLTEDFAEINGFQLEHQSLCSEDSCGIYAMRNVIDGKELIELCLIKCHMDKGSASVSLYYIPRGDIRNICLIGRFCKHKVEHPNLDGTKIKSGQVHFHKYTEEFYDQIYKIIGESQLKKLLQKLESPDAEAVENIETNLELKEHAYKFFNVVPGKEIEVATDIKQKEIYYIDLHDGGRIQPGVSPKNLTSLIGKEIEKQLQDGGLEL